QVDECPMAAGNRHLGLKEVLDGLEERSAGAKAAFLFSFYDRGREHFVAGAADEREGLVACPGCGSPTTGDRCAFCTLRNRASCEHTPVELRAGPAVAIPVGRSPGEG
ncbi:MAG: hypothetical protein ACXW1S_08305, partial [Acidimicrobiia bacterium]